MVVVVMANQYEIDFWQVAYRNAGRSDAFRTRKRDGACSLRPDRIGQNIQAIHLNKDGRVIDVSGTYAVLYAVWNC